MSSTIIRMVSLSVDSLIAIVPDSECRTPILIVPLGLGAGGPGRTRDHGSGRPPPATFCLNFMLSPFIA